MIMCSAYPPMARFFATNSVVWYVKNSSRGIFVLKLIFFAFLALVETKLLENNGVQIFRPPLPILEVISLSGPPGF